MPLTRRLDTPTLQATAEHHARGEYERRLGEIKALAPLLARLDELTPALAQRGIKLWPDQLHLTHAYAGGRSRMTKMLRITGSISLHQSKSRWLFTALRGMGFELLRHVASGRWPVATLKRGLLIVEVDLSAAEALDLLAETAHPEPAHEKEAA